MFGNQGALWGNAMTWWDHGTGSVWSQPLGEAIVGPRKGDQLELRASTLTRWSTWHTDHPATLALEAPGGHSGFDVRSMAVVVDFGEEVGVYPFIELTEHGPANDVVADVPVAVVADPEREESWQVFHREVGGQTLTLLEREGQLVDEQTGTAWDPSTGLALDGPLQGEIMDILPGFTSFESDARTFWPQADFWEGQ